MYFILYGYMVYVLSISNVRGQVWCQSVGRCGSTECPQYDHRGQSCRQTLQMCKAGEETRPGDPCLFNLARPHRTVRIYGHYTLIDGNNATFYRHPIHIFDFTALDGKEKWTAIKFVRNVYDVWMPTHLSRIRSAIDQIPSDLDFGLLQQSELQFPVTPSSNHHRN